VTTFAAPAARILHVTRTLHVEHCMGTAFTIDIRDRGDWTAAIADVVAWLHLVDRIFSTYRADSEISRIGRGELRVADADPLVAEVLDRCAVAQRETGGYFSSMPAGRLDPTGLVKGWSIERASDLLTAAGATNHAVNGGGDMQLAGEPSPGQPWTVGISNPADRTRVLSTVSGRDLAVATSGLGERGAHIVNPFTGRAAESVASATVVGPRLTEVDTYATAAVVMGPSAVGWVESLDGYEALVVDTAGAVRTTSGWAGAVPGSASRRG
jgi:thiamine biosynthesis lipoprotein